MELLLNRIHQRIGIGEFIKIGSNQYQIDMEYIEELTNNIISSLLAAILLQGDTEDTNFRLLDYKSNITNKPTIEDNKILITSSLLNFLFHGKLDEFVKTLSLKSNISIDVVRNMSIVLTHVYITQLLDLIVSEQFSINGLFGHLLGERDYYIDHIPEEVMPLLGISSKHNLGKNISADAIVVSNTVRYTLLYQKKEKESASKKNKKNLFSRIFRK